MSTVNLFLFHFKKPVDLFGTWLLQRTSYTLAKEQVILNVTIPSDRSKVSRNVQKVMVLCPPSGETSN